MDLQRTDNRTRQNEKGVLDGCSLFSHKDGIISFESSQKFLEQQTRTTADQKRFGQIHRAVAHHSG